jgi:hypothetical protein
MNNPMHSEIDEEHARIVEAEIESDPRWDEVDRLRKLGEIESAIRLSFQIHKSERDV